MLLLHTHGTMVSLTPLSPLHEYLCDLRKSVTLEWSDTEHTQHNIYIQHLNVNDVHTHTDEPQPGPSYK